MNSGYTNLKMDDNFNFTNVTNSTEEELNSPYTRSIPEKMARYIMWSTTAMAITGNVLLLVVFSQRKVFKVHDILIATLAGLDLVHASMNILMNVLPRSIRTSHPQAFCYFAHFMYHYVLLASCFTLAEITIDRLLAVCSVLFHRIHATKKKCLVVIGCTQLLVFALMTPSAGICIDGMISIYGNLRCRWNFVTGHVSWLGT